MGAVHRVDSYIREVETENLEKQVEIPEDWPQAGKIQYVEERLKGWFHHLDRFKDVVMSYFPGEAPVLKGVTVTIKPGEKIGIAGRTGSGKTSLIMSLFRLVEPSSGTIEVDGINLAEIGMHEMRGRFSIIPQGMLITELKTCVIMNSKIRSSFVAQSDLTWIRWKSTMTKNCGEH